MDSQRLCEQQPYYYAQVPGHPTPVAAYPHYPPYYAQPEPYVMAAPPQPQMVMMSQPIMYVQPEMATATPNGYMGTYYAAPSVPSQMYYQDMYMHQQAQQTAPDVRPLLTSTPLPTEYQNMQNYQGNVVPVSQKRREDFLVNVSKITDSSDSADDTMCETSDRQHESSDNGHRRFGNSFKSKMCHSYVTGMPCVAGSRCRYAHSPEDRKLEQKNMRYKTKLCKNYADATFVGMKPICPYGDRCEFIHPSDKEFADLPVHIRNAVHPAVLNATLSRYASSETLHGNQTAYRRPAPEKIILKNRNSAASMVCLNTIGRREDDSAFYSGSSESTGSMQNLARPRTFYNVNQQRYTSRRRSLSQMNINSQMTRSSSIGDIADTFDRRMKLQ